MLAIRHIPALMALAVLTACVQPKVETAETSLNVIGVDVSVAGAIADVNTVVTGRQAGIGPGQFVADLEAELSTELGAASDPAGTEALVTVAVSEVYLSPPVERAVAGTSYIVGTVIVTDTNGNRLAQPTAVRGNTENIRLVGALGLATTQSVENDYRGTLRGFAKTVRNALFGEPDV